MEIINRIQQNKDKEPVAKPLQIELPAWQKILQESEEEIKADVSEDVNPLDLLKNMEEAKLIAPEDSKITRDTLIKYGKARKLWWANEE